MKPTLLSIVCILFFGLFATCQETHYDWAILNLKGKVKTLSETEFIAIEVSGEIQKNGMRSSYGGDICSSFNIKGKIDTLVRYSSKGEFFAKYIYTYNERGLLIELEKSYRKFIFKYNTKGELVEELMKPLPHKYRFFYNDKGDLIEKHSIDEDTSIFITRYEYDSEGNMIKKQLYKRDGSKDFGYTYQYNEKGKIIEQVAYLSDGSQNYKETYQYNDRGNCTMMNRYNAENEIDFTEEYQYKFDEIGNWIERIVLKNNTPIYITERKIEYF